MRVLRFSLPGLGLLALSLLALDGCGGGSETKLGPQVSPTRSFQTLQFQVETDKAVYTPGQNMKLTFRVTNTGTDPVSIVYSDSDTHRFRLTRAENSHESIQFPPQDFMGRPESVLTIAPGQTQTFQRAWNLSLWQNKPVPGGYYVVTAKMTGRIQSIPAGSQQENDLMSNPLTVRLWTPCEQDPLYAVPGEVIVGIYSADTDNQELIRFIETIGTISSRRVTNTQNPWMLVTLNPDFCIADAVSYLETNPKIRYADPNGIGMGGGS